MEEGFIKANSSNLPKVDLLMLGEFLASNKDFCSAEFRNVKATIFSSRAESLMHRQWGGHLVNMTTVPEVVLAKEAGLSYAAVALITDYDCWRENETSVSVSEVLEMFSKNVKKAAQVIIDAVKILAADTDLSYLDAHKELVSSSIMLKE